MAGFMLLQCLLSSASLQSDLQLSHGHIPPFIHGVHGAGLAEEASVHFTMAVDNEHAWGIG